MDTTSRQFNETQRVLADKNKRGAIQGVELQTIIDNVTQIQKKLDAHRFPCTYSRYEAVSCFASTYIEAVKTYIKVDGEPEFFDAFTIAYVRYDDDVALITEHLSQQGAVVDEIHRGNPEHSQFNNAAVITLLHRITDVPSLLATLSTFIEQEQIKIKPYFLLPQINNYPTDPVLFVKEAIEANLLLDEDPLNEPCLKAITELGIFRRELPWHDLSKTQKAVEMALVSPKLYQKADDNADDIKNSNMLDITEAEWNYRQKHRQSLRINIVDEVREFKK